MKLGIAGTGSIVREILPVLRNPDIEITALCGTVRSKEKVNELCKTYQIGQAFCEYDRMITESDIDTVYVAVPNFLHYSFAERALEAGKNVIVEKPMTSSIAEAEKLSDLARRKNRYLFEAISTLYLPNYNKIREWLLRIGTVKIVTCNFSQYSSRYDDFRNGTVLPVFDPEKAGGALMDLNLYNLHYLMGLFGEPRSVKYLPNMERGIDTSGILTLAFDGFRAVSIAAKDCSAPWNYVIQGTDGYILQKSPANFCGEVLLHLKDGTEETFDSQPASRLEPEFRAFIREIASGKREFCYKMLEQSVAVSRVQTKARLDAGIYFPGDKEL